MNIENKNENIKNLFKRKNKTNQSNNVDNNDLKNTENNNLQSSIQNNIDNLNSNQFNEISDNLNDNNNYSQMNQGYNLNKIDEDTNYSEINEYNYLKPPNNENKKEDLQIKSNLHKTRIIEAEINSGLFLQILIYYNIFSSIITFAFQIFTISFKIWIFRKNNFSVIRLALLIFWSFIEVYRLSKAYSANIEESFPELIKFNVLTFVFSIPPQILLIIGGVGGQVLPIDKSCFIVYISFAIMEILVSIFVMNKLVKRKAAVYFLHNTTTETITSFNNKNNKTSKDLINEVNIYMNETETYKHKIN